MTRRLPVVAALLLVAVVLLGLWVQAGGTHAFDQQIAHALGLRGGTGDDIAIAFMQAVSWIGGGLPRWIIVILLAALVCHWRGWRFAAALAGTSLAAMLASSLFKLAFGVVRPDVIPHLDHQTSFSYPSGHATSAAVVYLLLAWMAPRRWHAAAWTLAGAMIAWNGLSRMALGVHWASDIIGGTMLGTAFALLGIWWLGPQGPRRA